MMRWEKQGNLFNPELLSDWPYTHGAVPFIESIEDELVSVLFTTRDKENKSLLVRAKLLFTDTFRLHSYNPVPLLQPGPIGMFDDAGTMGSKAINIGGDTHLYYQGWNVGGSVPFRNAIGLATRTPDGRYKKFASGPILDRSIYDPCFVATPEVIRLSDSSFLMYYLSCESWTSESDGLKHRYNIKIAYSENGVDWVRRGDVAINFENEFEYAFSVPRVVIDNGRFKMWYSFRASSSNEYYQIGYAESDDGLQWQRFDSEVGIESSDEGWDSEMVCYPFIFDFRKERYMLYNGNGYGRTGFGIAKLISS